MTIDRRTLRQDALIRCGRCPRCGQARNSPWRFCTRCHGILLARHRQRYRPSRLSEAWTGSLVACGVALGQRGWR